MKRSISRPSMAGRAALVAFGLILTFSIPTQAASTAGPLPPGTGASVREKHPVKAANADVVPGRYIVVVKDGHAPKGLAAELRARPDFVYEAVLNGFAAELSDKQVEKLRRHPHVVSVEPVVVAEADATLYTQTLSGGQPYGLDRIDQRALPRNGTYKYYSSGAGVTVYVVDSGIAINHPEFGGRASYAVDYVDGTHADCHGHGTHVAGTIGGATYGVAKRVWLKSVRVLNCQNQGTSAGLIAGMEWVRLNARKPAVANISIGTPKSTAVNSAASNLAASGVFVAVSAGNDSVDACTASPASASGTLTVAASDGADTRWASSNWGGCVDMYAPGYSVLSANPRGGGWYMSGTSMASPHVAGTAAVIKATYGDVRSADLVKYVLDWGTANAIRGNVTGTPNRLLFQAW